MGRIATCLLAMVLMVCAHHAALPLHAHLAQLDRPPITTPDRAPYPISVFEPSTLVHARLTQGVATWTYRWQMTTPRPASEVISFYERGRPEALLPPEDTPEGRTTRILEYPPSGASPPDLVRIEIRQEGSITRIVIRETRQVSIWMPDLVSLRCFLYGLAAILALVLRSGIIAKAIRYPGELRIQRACPQFRLVSNAAPDSRVRARWTMAEEDLGPLGFTPAGDCIQHRAGVKYYSHLLHRRRRTWASLLHLRVDGQSKDFCELFTHFSDGSTVTTSNSPFPSRLKRPPAHPLHVVPPDTSLTDLVPVHEASVMRHVSAKKRDLETLPSCRHLVQVWRDTERVLYLFRKRSKLPLEEVPLRLFTTGALPAPSSSHGPIQQSPDSDHAGTRGEAHLLASSALSSETPDEFRQHVMDILRQDILGITLMERGPLLLEGQHGAWQDAIDLENLYTVCRHMPTQRDALIHVFVRRLRESMHVE